MRTTSLAELLRAHLKARSVILTDSDLYSLAEFVQDVLDVDGEDTKDMPVEALVNLRKASVAL